MVEGQHPDIHAEQGNPPPSSNGLKDGLPKTADPSASINLAQAILETGTLETSQRTLHVPGQNENPLAQQNGVTTPTEENSLPQKSSETPPSRTRRRERVVLDKLHGTLTTVDNAEFTIIFDEYGGPILSYIYHLVGDHQLAQDLTQDTFFKAWRAINKRKDGSLSAWLYRIATNTAYDAMRRRKLIAFSSLDERMDRTRPEDRQFEPTSPGNLEDDYVNGVLTNEALKKMPQHYRAALLLYTREGYSYAEIAKTLHIAETGVKMYLSRARHSFREHYRNLERENDAHEDMPQNERRGA